jgi:hypothetical protein
MDKKLWAHDRFMSTELKRLESPKKHDPSDVDHLWGYHLAVVRDLQHERLIHLVVTLFFAGLTLVAGAATIRIANFGDVQLTWTLAIITLIMLVTELAYLRHYYRLENGVQRLYGYTAALHHLRQRG